MHLRNVHAVGIRSWKDVKEVEGLGPAMLKQLMIFCKDPYLTPLKSDQPPIAQPPTPVKEELKSEDEADPSKNLASSDSEPGHGLTDDSDSEDEVQKIRRQKKKELKIAKEHERQKRS